MMSSDPPGHVPLLVRCVFDPEGEMAKPAEHYLKKIQRITPQRINWPMQRDGRSRRCLIYQVCNFLK